MTKRTIAEILIGLLLGTILVQCAKVTDNGSEIVIELGHVGVFIEYHQE